jgi:hypothetical protein
MIRDEVLRRVRRQSTSGLAGVRRAPPASALIEQHDTVRGRIEQPAAPRRAARPGSAVDHERRLAVGVPARLPRHEVAVADVEHPVPIGLDLSDTSSVRSTMPSRPSSSDEPQQFRPFRDELVLRRLRQAFERLDLENRPSGFPLGRPRRADAPVHEHQAPIAARDHAGPMLLGDDARSVGVTQRRVVELGRKRTGAGVAGSGRGAPGTSNSSRPCSSRKVRSCGRRRSRTSRIAASPDHDCTSLTLAGPNAARYRRTMASGERSVPNARPSHDPPVTQAAGRSSPRRRAAGSARGASGSCTRTRARPHRGRATVRARPGSARHGCAALVQQRTARREELVHVHPLEPTREGTSG